MMLPRKIYFILLPIFIFVFLIFVYGIFFTPIPRNYLGENLFLKFHNNNLAIIVLKILHKDNNTDFKTFFLLGRIYFVEGELQESINNYIKAIELEPKYKESYYGRGLSYGFSGNKYLIQAQNDFEKYIELEEEEFRKSGRRAYGAWAGYNDLAWIHFLKGDFAAQEKTAREGLEISAYNPWLQNILGVALLAQKKCVEAKPHLESAKKLLDNTSVEKFGEAYSGDDQTFWKLGLEKMKKVIGENLEICQLR